MGRLRLSVCQQPVFRAESVHGPIGRERGKLSLSYVLLLYLQYTKSDSCPAKKEIVLSCCTVCHWFRASPLIFMFTWYPPKHFTPPSPPNHLTEMFIMPTYSAVLALDYGLRGMYVCFSKIFKIWLFRTALVFSDQRNCDRLTVHMAEL